MNPIKWQNKIPGNGKAFCETPQLQLRRSNQNPSSFHEPWTMLVGWVMGPPSYCNNSLKLRVLWKNPSNWGRCITPPEKISSTCEPACRLRTLRKAEFSKYFQNIHDIATVWTPQSKGASTLFLSRRQSHRKSRTRFPWWKVHDADRIDMDRFQHDFKSWHYLQPKQNLYDLERFSQISDFLV